jgi:hypothetical protein
MKNNVASNVSRAKENNKLEIERLRREMRETNKDIDLTPYSYDADD